MTEVEMLKKEVAELNDKLKKLTYHYQSIKELYNKEIRKNDLPEIRMIHAKRDNKNVAT